MLPVRSILFRRSPTLEEFNYKERVMNKNYVQIQIPKWSLVIAFTVIVLAIFGTGFVFAQTITAQADIGLIFDDGDLVVYADRDFGARLASYKGGDLEVYCPCEESVCPDVDKGKSIDEATEKSTPETIQTSTPSSTQPTPTQQSVEPTSTPYPSGNGNGNNGHGNDQDHCDSSNPGNSPNCRDDDTDDDGFPPGQNNPECPGPPGQCR